MKRLLRWFGLCFGFLVIAFALPVGYVEVACRPVGETSPYIAILPPQDHRAEGKTLLTYPEWHIVHAYEEYAEVISNGDPHQYRYLSAIGGFWSSLCSLSKASGKLGGFPSAFKQTVYTIGVSFSAELFAKAAYEETLGRIATWVRGPERTPLDDLSAQQAHAYSHFLRQVPWYKWDFTRHAASLSDSTTAAFRDRERRTALGLEYAAKARYAKVIAAAVANMEPDALRLRMIVAGLSAEKLARYSGVKVITQPAEGIEIEVPRYRALTDLLAQIAAAGGDFVEIAGNDDILLTVTSDYPALDQAFFSFERQGFGDTRHLVLLKVTELAETLRGIDGKMVRLEHIHDY